MQIQDNTRGSLLVLLHYGGVHDTVASLFSVQAYPAASGERGYVIHKIKSYDGGLMIQVMVCLLVQNSDAFDISSCQLSQGCCCRGPFYKRQFSGIGQTRLVVG